MEELATFKINLRVETVNFGGLLTVTAFFYRKM